MITKIRYKNSVYISVSFFAGFICICVSYLSFFRCIKFEITTILKKFHFKNNISKSEDPTTKIATFTVPTLIAILMFNKY